LQAKITLKRFTASKSAFTGFTTYTTRCMEISIICEVILQCLNYKSDPKFFKLLIGVMTSSLELITSRFKRKTILFFFLGVY